MKFQENKQVKNLPQSKQVSRRKQLQQVASTFLRYSTIHGFRYLVGNPKVHPAERFIWFCLTSICVYCTFSIGFATWTRYQENPTVITIEREYLNWNNTYPSITLCPSTKLNEQKLNSFVSKSQVNDKELLRDFLVSLVNASYKNFEDVIPNDEVNPDDYMSILADLQFNFHATVTISASEMTKVEPQQVVTEMGICYMINSKLAVYNSLDFWKNGPWKIVKGQDVYTVHALDGEVLANIVNISTGFELYIHGPYEVADIASKSIYSPNGYFLQVYLAGLTLFSSERIRDLNVNQRKCRFYDESDLRHSPAYSYVLCRMECRATLAKRLCGCTPHFYRRLDGDKVCDVTGLHCLAKFKERLIILKGECNCLANCDEVNYLVEDMDTREWFLGSNLQWGLKDYPKMRLRRDVIFGFSDLLVYIGGMAGLFLGCSVLSFIEIFYFFTMRLYWYVVTYREETKRLIK